MADCCLDIETVENWGFYLSGDIPVILNGRTYGHVRTWESIDAGSSLATKMD